MNGDSEGNGVAAWDENIAAGHLCIGVSPKDRSIYIGQGRFLITLNPDRARRIAADLLKYADEIDASEEGLS